MSHHRPGHESGCSKCNGKKCKCPTGATGATGAAGSTGGTGGTGETGSPGPGTGGLLKFSGVVPTSDGPPVIRYLADVGVDTPGSTILQTPVRYPIARARSLQDFSVNIFQVIAAQTSVQFDLVKNVGFVEVILATIIFVGGEGSLLGQIKNQSFGPTPLTVGETIDIRVTNTGSTVNASATVGIL